MSRFTEVLGGMANRLGFKKENPELLVASQQADPAESLLLQIRETQIVNVYYGIFSMIQNIDKLVSNGKMDASVRNLFAAGVRDMFRTLHSVKGCKDIKAIEVQTREEVSIVDETGVTYHNEETLPFLPAQILTLERISQAKVNMGKFGSVFAQIQAEESERG